MALGTANKFSIYIVRQDDDPPDNISDFRDYSRKFTRWNIKIGISSLATFSGSMTGERNTIDISAGSLLYVLSGTKLIGKFVIENPDYSGNKSISIKGIQSSGSNFDNRMLSSESTCKSEYKQQTVEEIYASINGMVKDPNGNIICTTDIEEGSLTTIKYNLKIDYEPCISAVTRFGRIAQYEWFIYHGINNETPYSEGDVLYLKTRIGSEDSVYTFKLSGLGVNCKITSVAGIDAGSIINDINVYGIIQNGIQERTRDYLATGVYTYTDGAIDAWLYEDLIEGVDVMGFESITGTFVAGEKIIGSAGGTAILIYDEGGGNWSATDITGSLANVGAGDTVTGSISGATATHTGWAFGSCNTIKICKGHGIPLTSTLFLVHIDSENILVSSIGSSTNYDILYVESKYLYYGLRSGRGTASTATKDTAHKAGADVIRVGDGIEGEPINMLVVRVEDASDFPANTQYVRIGHELFQYISKTDTTLTLYRVYYYGSGYSHGDGIRVKLDKIVPDSQEYLPWHPDPNSDNSIATYGIKTSTVSLGNALNKDALDRVAVALINSRALPTKIVLEAADPFNTFDNIDIGDTITITNASGSTFNIADGQYRITGFEYSFNLGSIRLVYYIEDNLIRIWMEDISSYIDKAVEVTNRLTQGTLYDMDSQKRAGALGDEDIHTASASTMYNQVKYLIEPSDPADASTKRYVDNLVGGTSSSLYKTKITASDTTANYLSSKIIEGTNITFELLNPGGNEAIQISGTNYWSVSGSWLAPVSDSYPRIVPCNSGTPNTVVDAYIGDETKEYERIYSNWFITHNQTTSWITMYNGVSTHRIINNYPGGSTILECGGNIWPTTTGLCDLGRSTASQFWNNIFANTLYLNADNIYFRTAADAILSYHPLNGIIISHLGDTVISFSRYYSSINAQYQVNAFNGLQCYITLYSRGNTILGDSSGDTITATGRFDTELTPSVDITNNLGSSSLRWNNIYAKRAYLERLNTTGRIDIDGFADFGGNVDIAQDLNVYGTKNCVMDTISGKVRLACTESPSSMFHDNGSAMLTNGSCTIQIDNLFTEVTEQAPLFVYVTPTSDCNGIYVSDKTATSFTVKELASGRSNATFDYMIFKLRKGYKDKRFCPVSDK